MPAQIKISLSNYEEIQLEKIINSSISPVRLIKRAKAILMAADGLPNYRISEQLGITPNTAGRWRNRFSNQRLEGITRDLPRGLNQGGIDR